MSRITTPADIASAPAASQPLLEAVKAKLGSAPNLFRLVGNSPAALKAYLDFSGALGGDSLGAALHEQIALAVANVNGCGYCNSAHSFIGEKLLKLDPAEIEASRRGTSNDARTAAALKFAVAIVEARGHVDAAAVAEARLAGFSEAQLVEIVAHVALNTFTNYVNEVFATEIDFPRVALANAA